MDDFSRLIIAQHGSVRLVVGFYPDAMDTADEVAIAAFIVRIGVKEERFPSLLEAVAAYVAAIQDTDTATA